jgi:hypothetical protein
VFQTSELSKTSIELVKLENESVERIRETQYFRYKLKLPPSVLGRFENLAQAYYHAERLFEAKHLFSSLAKFGDGTCIVSPIEIEERFLYSIGKNDDSNKIDIIPIKEKLQLNLANPDHLEIFSHVFYQSLRHSISDTGYEIRRTTAIDKSTNLLAGIRHYSRNEIFRKIQQFIYLFPAFSFRLRRLGQEFFVQISPRSVVEFGKDLYSLRSECVFSTDELTRISESVSLPIGRIAKLYALLGKTAADPINEKPFNGNSFLEFAEKMYTYPKFKKHDANLILVLPYGNTTLPWYFSSELVKPSVRFSDLAGWDHEFYAKLGSEMKTHSARRRELIENYLKTIKFRFLDVDLKLSDLFSYEATSVTMRPSEFAQNSDMPVFIFASPWLSFKDRETDRVVHVNRDVTGHLGATVDLLTHDELACFNSPGDVKIKIISDESLYNDACTLVDVLAHGFGDYKGFEQIFGTKLIYDEIIPVKDLLSETKIYSDVSPDNYDCTLIFGPRRLPESFEKSRLIYTFPETEILNRGVPVQYVTDEPAQNKIYDKSIRTKSNDPHALFGIGLNILGKIGAQVMVLSPETTNYFLPNSIVIGYNIARIFEPLVKDVSQEESPRDLIRASTPLAAPIVMMSQDGAEIVMQDVYQIPNETSLFREDRAERIIDELSGNFSNFIIHKDGQFYSDEIVDVKKIQRRDRKVIPVSIVSNSSPRLFSSLASWNYIPRMGTVAKLSDVDFLMANPLVTQKYSPQSRGWPNTILITIHEEALEGKLSSVEKLQILYQIWALTRVHVGSQLPTRKPISTHYSDSMATFLRKVGNPRPGYFSNFGNRRNRHGYIPRIFL